MNLLTVNSGSSSVRLAVYAEDMQCVARAHHSHAGEARADGETMPARLLAEFMSRPQVGPIGAVAHRVVHGGERLTAPCRIDAAVEAEIGRLAELAPLHNPRALAWIHVCRGLLGADVPQVAVFDTAFYSNLPEVARSYALPKDLARRLGLRRYGFHGLAHRSLWRRWSTELSPRTHGRAISFQLGAGCSVTAIRDGTAVDTSMGFSPLEGLVMATRAGDVDPGLLLHLQRSEGLSAEQLEQMLNTESGLLGISGESSDMRTLLASDAAQAHLAVDLYCYRARKYLGAYLAALGGVDAILFGGGVGENMPAVRDRILEGMEWAGVVADAARNDAAIGTDARIDRPGSAVELWVVRVDESAVLAEEARTVLR